MGIGALTARALAEAQLERIRDTDGAIEAWAYLDPEHVRRAADRSDASRSNAPLRGIGVVPQIRRRRLRFEVGGLRAQPRHVEHLLDARQGGVKRLELVARISGGHEARAYPSR